MEEADSTMCERCMAINDANAEFCRRCGEPLAQNALMPTRQQSDTSSYPTRVELPEPPRNTLDELMRLSFGELIRFGIRFGVVLAIAQIIALVVIFIIIIVGAVLLTLLGIGIGNLFFGNLTSLAGV
jgi:hypothetical protein